MHIPHEFYQSYRATTSVCVLLSLFFWYQIYIESQDKSKLYAVTGKVTSVGYKAVRANGGGTDTIQHIGIEGNSTDFELYSESEPVNGKWADIRSGDVVTAYLIIDKSAIFRPAADVPTPPIVKFIEKNGTLYYHRPPFIIQIGVCMITLLYGLSIGSYLMYRAGKMDK